jgi:predicted nucleotidyltransferase
VFDAGQSGSLSREQAAFSRAAAAELQALAKASLVLTALQRLGVDAVVVGSLATGKFDDRSDVDFLIRACPRYLKYKIESLVEDLLDGIDFDVVYREELPPRVLARMEEALLTLADLPDGAHA